MPFNIIETLRSATPEQRGEILQATYRKNTEFFKNKYPVINKFLQKGTCPYRIDMTEKFLNIVHGETNEIAHPEAGLDLFAETLGSWTHQGWRDLFNLKVIYPEREGYHNKYVRRMFELMEKRFPEHNAIWNRGRLNLKEMPDGKRFSPPIVFLGIFHGLHIAHLFNTTVFTDALFIEPDPARFEVSCYFLDYQEIVERLGSFHVYVGQEVVNRHFARFFNDYYITQHMWVRALPAYTSDKMALFLESIKALQTTRSDTVFAYDDHVQGLKNGRKNIVRHLPLLTKQPKLSRDCSIAVVASGPSLTNDLAWLAKNKDKLLIFAVHSSVRVLRKHGIKPDLQISLDTLLTKETLAKLDLYRDVPLVNNYKVGGEAEKVVEKLLLAGDRNASNAVSLICPLQYTTPSSSNLAFSLACFCRPREIYLLGCDMGYRSLDESHVSGHHNDNNTSAEDIYKMASQMLTPANFKESLPLQTTSFLNSTRIGIEGTLADVRNTTTVINLSDGARIDGTVPRRSNQVKLPAYKKRSTDIKMLYESFEPMQEKVNWNYFPTAGEDALAALKENLLENLRLEEFDWAEFSRKLNNALLNAMENCGQEMGKDYRLAIYNKILLDLLCALYIYVIIRDSKEEAEEVYTEGYRIIKTILDELQWPEDVIP